MSINLPKNLKDIVSYILPITISFKFLKYDINILTLSTFSLTVTSTVIIVLLFSIFYLVRSPLTYMQKIPTENINNYVQQLQESGKSVSNVYPEIDIIR